MEMFSGFDSLDYVLNVGAIPLTMGRGREVQF